MSNHGRLDTEATVDCENSTVASYAVKFPERTSLGMGRSKPKACLEAHLETGPVMEIKLPVAAAGLLRSHDIAVPCDKDEFFAAVRVLEERSAKEVLAAKLDRRDFTELEAKQRLMRDGFLPDIAEEAVSWACGHRFIDDNRYARFYIESKKRAGWGKRRIERELSMRGVDAESIEGYPEAFFDDDSDIERALRLLERKRVPETRPYEKLVRFLVGKGFDYRCASEAVKCRLDRKGS